MRTDPNRHKHAPADAHPDEQREGTRHARRAAKDEALRLAEEERRASESTKREIQRAFENNYHRGDGYLWP